MRVVGLAVVVGVLCAASPAAAQFRNQGIQAPNIGYLGLGSLWDRALNGGRVAEQNLDVNGGVPDAGWNLADEPTVGMGYFFAIGYQLWVDNEVAIGAWTTILDEVDKSTPVITLAVSSGLRYNLLEERHRPYIAGHIQYLQLMAFPGGLAPAPIPGNNFLGNTPFFIGVRPAVGYEWIFGDEQSVQLEVGVVGFLVPDPNRGAGGLFLPASVGRFSYNIYF